MTNKIISKTIQIKCDKLPPKVNYIEEQIKAHGFIPLRWAIVDINKNELIVSLSGYEV